MNCSYFQILAISENNVFFFFHKEISSLYLNKELHGFGEGYMQLHKCVCVTHANEHPVKVNQRFSSFFLLLLLLFTRENKLSESDLPKFPLTNHHDIPLTRHCVKIQWIYSFSKINNYKETTVKFKPLCVHADNYITLNLYISRSQPIFTHGPHLF